MCHGLDIADKRRGVKVKFSVRWCLALALRQNLLDFLLAMLVVTERGDLFGAVAALVHDGNAILVGFEPVGVCDLADLCRRNYERVSDLLRWFFLFGYSIGYALNIAVNKFLLFFR